MNVLIFGGTGFVGRNLTDELLINGYQVSVVTRNRQTANSLRSGVKLIEWDNISLSFVCIAGNDAVINLAGESIGTAAGPLQ